MKKLIGLVLVSVLGGVIALGGYKLFFQNQPPAKLVVQHVEQYPSASGNASLVANNPYSNVASLPNFTKVAEKTVHAVVHVKNVEMGPRNLFQYWNGIRSKKYVYGTGSGVIITPDGYIVTNYHVIKGATELKVTLYNKKTYTAKVIGTAPQQDIALIKIDAHNLEYLPFGNSDDVKVGQWVLAVGNPFNLTSTVTAGIISAKGRNLNEGGKRMLSFLQTDAAINPGNSGGALVNIHGQLIGINSAITSRTGSYIGYSFAIPSNNARKIVEDLMQYGNVKNALLGVNGNTVVPKMAKKLGIDVSQGVLVASSTFGAKKAGLEKGDVITKIDQKKVHKWSDLVAYIRTKRPGDQVQVDYLRNGKKHETEVTLAEYETYVLQAANLEVTNASKAYLSHFNAGNGVRIVQSTSRNRQIPKDHYIIVAIDGQPVKNVDQVQKIIQNNSRYERTKITFQGRNGQRETLAF